MRYLSKIILSDLDLKMVFLGGPRQVGKTTLALAFLDGNEKHPAYFNWDSLARRKALLEEELPENKKLIVLDEIHKYRQWRNLVKGLYDTNRSSRQFLVTGSARLDIYRKGGDSLQGRYHFIRLHPFSLPELEQLFPGKFSVRDLLDFGGFPEPLFSKSKRTWRRWQKERLSRVLHDDIVGVELVKDLMQLDLLMGVLPEKIGSPLSLNNLAKDLAVAHATIERWITILERVFHCFRIAPFGIKNLQTMRKEKKLYLWDWSQCLSEGAKFENMVASILLKFCHFHEDTEGYEMRLCYIRDKSHREIDFVVLKDKKPLFAVECKSGDKALNPHIAYYAERTDIPVFYQVHLGTKQVEIAKHRAKIVSFENFCKLENLV